MRITESTLRKIIREELDAVVGEAPDGIKPIGSVPGNLSPRFRKNFQKLAAAGKKLERAIGAKRKASNVDLKLGIKQVPIKKLEKFDELVGKIMKGKLSADQAAEEYEQFNPKAPMEESGHFDRTPEQKLKTALMAMNTKSPMDSESNANAIIAYNEESELYQDVLKNIAVHGAPSREDLQKLVDAHAKRNFDPKARRQHYRLDRR